MTTPTTTVPLQRTPEGRWLLDRPAALAMLDAAVADRGVGFLYADLFGAGANCAYMDCPTGQLDRVPACIVGVGLADLAACNTEGGFSFDDLDRVDAPMPACAGWSVAETYAYEDLKQAPADWFATAPLVASDCDDLDTALGIEATESAARILWAAQLKQDDGKSWGEARDFAEAVAANVTED